jgi:CRP-like cAMP-binding protein
MRKSFRIDPVTRLLESVGIPRSAATPLARAGTLIQLPSDATLCRVGERGREAFIILEGEASVLLPDRIVTLGAGDVVGELATLDPARTRNATVIATTDLLVLVFDAGTFNSLAREPALAGILRPERSAA